MSRDQTQQPNRGDQAVTHKPGLRETRRRVRFAKEKELIFAANSAIRRRHMDGSLVSHDPAQREYVGALIRDMWDNRGQQ